MTFEELEEIGLILRTQGLKGVVLCNLCTTKSPGTARELWDLGIPVVALSGGLSGFEDLSPSQGSCRTIPDWRSSNSRHR